MSCSVVSSPLRSSSSSPPGDPPPPPSRPYPLSWLSGLITPPSVSSSPAVEAERFLDVYFRFFLVVCMALQHPRALPLPAQQLHMNATGTCWIVPGECRSIFCAEPLWYKHSRLSMVFEARSNSMLQRRQIAMRRLLTLPSGASSVVGDWISAESGVWGLMCVCVL